MQTPKARNSSRSISSEASPKNSPSSEASQKVSPRVARQLKTGPRYSEHTASSSNLASRPPKERSPKVADRASPRSPASSEKKRPGRVAELESQITQLENDLKTVKDQLCLTETAKKEVQQEAEESNKQIAALSLKLEEFQKQFSDQSDQTLLQSELEAVREKHRNDTAVLTSALDEIEQLKARLTTVAESEGAHSKQSESDQAEIFKLKESLSDALLLTEDMKNQLKECKESEAKAQAVVGETLMQLEAAKQMVETLKSDGLRATEVYNAVASELDQSRARVIFLEELVNKHKSDVSNGHEVEGLKSALEAAEIRYNEERTELVEKMKSETSKREEEMEAEIRKCKYEIEELKANLMDKETELQGICEENEGLTLKLESMVSGQRETELEKEIESVKLSLIEKDKMWRTVMEENEKLKLEMKEVNKVLEIEAAEKEAVMKVGYMAEELDKSNRKVARAAEQLEAAEAANAGMEMELRRLKVQSDQWRKAAEAAAAMLNNGQIMERTGSMDSHYSPRSGKIGSPYGDDVDDDVMKKKNANMLRRIGVLWKKPQK